MAMSGYKDIKVTNYNTLRFQWWESGTQDIANNSTLVGWKMELIATGAGAISSSVAKSWWVNVNGNYYEGTNYINISNNTTKTLASGYTNITHNTDGTKSFAYSFSQTFDITFNGTSIGSASGGSTGTLTTIPRKATITDAENFSDEAIAVTVKYNNPAGNVADILQLCICSTDGSKIYVPYRNISKTDSKHTLIFKDSEKEALRKAVTSGLSTTVQYCIYSKIGGTEYYSTLNKTFSIHAGTPVINAAKVYDTNTFAISLTGSANVMIKHYNTMYMEMTPAARKGATIVKSYCKCGEEYVEDSWAYWDNATSNYFKFTTVDSRGNQTSQEITVPMVDYIPLTANIEADISLDGTDGTKANIEFTVSGNYFNGSFGAKDNTLNLSYTVRDEADLYIASELVIPDGAIDNNTYRVSHTISGLDYKGSYTVTVEAMDKVKQHVYAASKTLKAVPVFDWSENDFNFNVPVAIKGDLVVSGSIVKADGTEQECANMDYPVEQGVKDGWSYRKWKSNRCECWKTVTVNTAITSAWGSMYVGNTKMARQNYPYPFKSKPVEIANLCCSSNAAWLFAESNGNGVNGGYASAIYNVCRPSQAANEQDFYIMLYAYGDLLN